MSPRPGGLGRGLSALIDLDRAGARFAEIPIADVQPNPRQPRTVFDQDALDELAESIRQVGVLQPIVVRETAAGRYELVMGERRWRAAQVAGLGAIPAIVRAVEDDTLLRDALLENLHRTDLNPLEEAAAYQQLLTDFGITHEDLASRVGRSRPHVTNTLRLLSLPPPVQRRVAAGVLSAGHARALLAVTDPAAQEELADRVVAEGWSVRALEEAVAVGWSAPRARRARGARTSDPENAALANRLAERLDTRVRIERGRSKGRIVVEFGSAEDLARILDLLAP